MRNRILGIIAIMMFLFVMSLYGQDVVVKILPYDGTAATFVTAQIVADTTAAGDCPPTAFMNFSGINII
jgi:hypothetical protein